MNLNPQPEDFHSQVLFNERIEQIRKKLELTGYTVFGEYRSVDFSGEAKSPGSCRIMVTYFNKGKMDRMPLLMYVPGKCIWFYVLSHTLLNINDSLDML